MTLKSNKKTAKEQVGRIQIKITARELLVRQDKNLQRIGFDADIFKGSELTDPKILTAGIVQACKELKVRNPTANISLPSSLFDINGGEITTPANQNRTQVAQLNRAQIKQTSREEYSDIAIDNVSKNETNQYHVVHVTARRSSMLAIMTAIKAANVRITSIEPQVMAELRTYASLYPESALSMLSVEKNASFIATILYGNVIEIAREDGLENLLLTVHPELNTAIEMVARGEEDLSTKNQTNLVTRTISERTSSQMDYAESLFTRHPTEQHLVLGGELDVQGMAGILSNEMLQHYASLPASSITGNLATEGLGLRPQHADSNLAVNLITNQSREQSGVHPAVLPGIILLAGLGSYGYATVKVSNENSRIAAATSERDTLAPKVREQTRLFDENQEIQKDIDRSKQLQNQETNLSAEIRGIVDRIPEDNIGVVSLQLNSENRPPREFNERKIQRSYQIEIQSRSQTSTQEFINAFETSPYAISVSDISRINENGIQKVIAIIGVEPPLNR